MPTKARSLLVVCVLTLATAGLVFAQGGGTGTVLGTVTDNSGAVVANAEVNVTNTATGVVAHTQTSSSGDFTVPSLNPGVYSVSVEATGFQKAVTSGVVLSVDQKARVNVALKPGAVSTTIEVNATAVTLDTDTAAVTTLVTQKQVEELPLNGRNFVQLLLLGEGAVTVQGEQGTMRQGAGNAISINGGRPESNNYTLDGLVNTDTALNTPAVILSQDAIQEFKEQGGNYSAEYGFSANQVNIVSKGGTNQLHGSVFETARNDAFDANGPEPNAGTFTPLPELRQNQFGFVAGGPVYFGRLYDGRNKTFWLANYEGWRIRNGGAQTGIVPDPAQLGGNFSNSGLPAFGTPECTAELANDRPCMPIDPTTGAPFSGNIIPPQRFSRFAQVTAGVYFPAPTCPTCTGNNYSAAAVSPITSNQQTYRLDQSLGRLGTIFGRGTYSNYTNSTFTTLSRDPGTLNFDEISKSWTVSHTISFSHNLVNNFRFGYLSAVANQGGPAPPDAAISQLALTGIFPHFASGQASWPNLTLSQFGGTGGPINAYTASRQPMWEFADSLTMVRGRHTFTMGADYRRWHLIRNLDNDFFGDYTFTNDLITSTTTPCPTPQCGTGNAIADYLLGYYQGVGGFFPAPLSSTKEAGNPQDHVFSYFAPFFQDDWKVTNRLTLNLGLRWDYRAAPYEVSNHFFWLDDKNPLGGLCYADKTLSTNGVAPEGNGVYEYCGSNVPHPGSKTPFAPRVGFAYRMFSKTVVRGGYGIYWDSSEGREIDDSGDLYPYAVRQNLTPATNPAAPKLTDNLFPSFTALNPIDPASLTFLAVIESDNPLNPYIEQWTLSVQHELARNTTLEVNYVGTKGIHLLDRRQIAQPFPLAAADVPFCQADPTDVAHNCPTTTRLPYAHFPGIYINSDWHGYSNYNAGTVKLEHRTTSLALTALYTWAKSMDDKSAAAGIGGTAGTGWQGFMNNHNPDLDYGPSDFDVDHRFVASYVYNLPIGRGKRFGGSMSRVADALVGGWEVTGVTTFQTGFPYSIAATDVNGLLGTFFQRADLVPGCNPNSGFTRSINEWFNTSCFVNPPAGVYGTTKRNFLRAPGINNWDMGLAKAFKFGERVAFQLRIDTFNTFNHPQFDDPPGGLIGFGQGGLTNPGSTLGSANFGKITAAAPGRIVQLGGKLTF